MSGAAAVVVAVVWVVGFQRQPTLEGRYVTLAVFGAMLVLLEARPMNGEDEGRQATFSWTFAFTLLLVAPLHIAIAISVLASFVGYLVRATTGQGEFAMVFTTAVSSLSLVAAGLVGAKITDLDAVAIGAEPELQWLFGVLVATMVGVLLTGALSGVARGLEGRLGILPAIRGGYLVQFRTDGFLLGLAPIFVVVASSALILMPVLLMVVWVILHSASVAMTNEHRATTDVLTGIPNRRTFETSGCAILDRCRIEDRIAAVIHLDLDGFKAINDRLGHQYGDGVLQQLAQRLEGARRSGDLLARLGGDEFAIVLGSVSGDREAEIVARRILSLVEEGLVVEGIPLQVSASLGVALFPDHGDNLATVLHHADLAMYRAKTDDVGVAVFSAGSASAPGRLSLVSELGDAMENDELGLHYQPKVDMLSGRILSVEALLRWHHPIHGMVSPGWFMPVAEQTDLMRDLTDHILTMALGQCAAWHRKGIEVGVAVNASARNLHDVRFPNRIRSLLEEVGLDPKWLEIEITENTIMEDPRRSATIMTELRNLGISISIDDFGTGYSSLANLRTLTIDRIKIDRCFITGLADSDADLTIARSIVELGRNLGLSVVAEGVETDEVLAIVRDLGVDEFQGHLASVPMAAEELEPVLIHGFLYLEDHVAVADQVSTECGTGSDTAPGLDPKPRRATAS